MFSNIDNAIYRNFQYWSVRYIDMETIYRDFRYIDSSLIANSPFARYTRVVGLHFVDCIIILCRNIECGVFFYLIWFILRPQVSARYQTVGHRFKSTPTNRPRFTAPGFPWWSWHKTASIPSEIISNWVCGIWLGIGEGTNVIISK